MILPWKQPWKMGKPIGISGNHFVRREWGYLDTEGRRKHQKMAGYENGEFTHSGRKNQPGDLDRMAHC